jgi:hypothetical protein
MRNIACSLLNEENAMSQGTPKKDASGDTIGEGNYDATRRYRQGLEESVKKGNAEELGKKAEKALEGPEGDALRRAEEQAKRGEIPKH